MNYKIAIDGPSGTGKSTTAKALAKKLSFIYIDTGAMYRAVGLYCVRNNINIENEELVKAILDDIDIDIFYKNGVQEIKLNGEIVSEAIRENNISKCASVVSAYKDVREKLVSIQRNLASKNSVIMDGRDIGTVVLPDADLKIYLVARPEIRTQRRYDELIAKGQKVEYDTIMKELEERDYRDTHRENSPLRQAEDAVVVDSSDMSVEKVVETINKLFKKKVGKIK